MKTKIANRLGRSAASLILGLVFSSSVMAFNPGGGGSSDPSEEYSRSGPYSTTSSSGGLGCTIYRPRNLDRDHPIILWGNGTGAIPSTYGRGLAHWASHGFVVAAANTSNAGTGEDMLDCLDYLIQQNNSSFGMFSGRLDTSKVGVSGHSQGGGGTIMAGQDRRITATAPMQPYVIGLGHRSSSQDRQHAPMLLLSGSADVIAGPGLNQAPVFRRVDVPVFWATLNGADHFEPVGDFGDYAGILTAWFLYHLKGDGEAGELFEGPCTMCNVRGWDIERDNF